MHCTTPHAGLLPSLSPVHSREEGAASPRGVARWLGAPRLSGSESRNGKKIGGRASPWGWQGLEVGCGVPTAGAGGLVLGIAVRASEL